MMTDEISDLKIDDKVLFYIGNFSAFSGTIIKFDYENQKALIKEKLTDERYWILFKDIKRKLGRKVIFKIKKG